MPTSLEYDANPLVVFISIALIEKIWNNINSNSYHKI